MIENIELTNTIISGKELLNCYCSVNRQTYDDDDNKWSKWSQLFHFMIF